MDSNLMTLAGNSYPSSHTITGAMFRMWAAIRVRQHTAGGSSVPAVAQAVADGIRGPVATLIMRSPSQWHWYDLGDVTEVNGVGLAFGFPTGWTAIASPAFNVSAIALFPRDYAYGVVYAAGEARPHAEGPYIVPDADDGNVLSGLGANSILAAAGATSAQNAAVNLGDVPVVPPIPSGGQPWWLAALAVRGNDNTNFLPTVSHHDQERVAITVAAWDRYTFAK